MKKNFKYIAIYKPFNVLSQFTSEDEKLCLGNYLNLKKDIYPVGRLDFDSEGLLLLTNDNYLKNRILSPEFEHKKTYFVQVEGEPNESDLIKFNKGIEIKAKGKIIITKYARAVIIKEPNLPERNPPIRFRKNTPTTWLSITLTEGKNRQVRKMTAALGFPTLRLIRYSINQLTLDCFGTEFSGFTTELISKEFSLSEIYKLLLENTDNKN